MFWHHTAAHEELPDTPLNTNLVNYLNGRKSLDKALDAFCSTTETKFMNTSKSESVESLLLETWTGLIAVASSTAHTSEKRQKLAEFIIALQRRPTLMKGDDTCQLHGEKVWKDLPEFGMQMREAWNLAATQASDQKHKDAWINLNAWTATLTAGSQSKGTQASDFSLFGLWAIRSALEQQEDVPEIAIRAATVWFVHAGNAIWYLCQEGKSFDGKLAKPGPQFASREWTGFEKDRWTSWEVQLKYITGRATFDTVTSSLVKEALAAMKAFG